MSELRVDLVAADRPVWSGAASLVIARTVDGDLGVLPGHESLLAALADGLVVIRGTEPGGDRVAAVHGGFISVADDTVALLAETAELAEEIDIERAKAALERVRRQGQGESSENLLEAERRAETRLRAAEGRI